jgi:hypothetical protein
LEAAWFSKFDAGIPLSFALYFKGLIPKVKQKIDIRQKSLAYLCKKNQLRDLLYLAPLQSFTDHHFRNAFQQVLGDVAGWSKIKEVIQV